MDNDVLVEVHAAAVNVLDSKFIERREAARPGSPGSLVDCGLGRNERHSVRNPGALTKVPGNLPFSRLNASRNVFGGNALRDSDWNNTRGNHPKQRRTLCTTRWRRRRSWRPG